MEEAPMAASISRRSASLQGMNLTVGSFRDVSPAAAPAPVLGWPRRTGTGQCLADSATYEA